MPRQLNWWIGLVFALGAAQFALGSILAMSSDLLEQWSLNNNQVNMIFFTGSIAFSVAAWLQLFQAANAGSFTNPSPVVSRRLQLLGWYPRNVGWLGCAMQFAGTLLFNVNTFDAMRPDTNWFQQDLLIWVPNILGSLLFLASGYLAFIEICHKPWACKPNRIAWWITVINLVGCSAFLLSALVAFVLPRGFSIDAGLSVTFTLVGALAFFLGALLLLPETSLEGCSD